MSRRKQQRRRRARRRDRRARDLSALFEVGAGAGRGRTGTMTYRVRGGSWAITVDVQDDEGAEVIDLLSRLRILPCWIEIIVGEHEVE